MTDKTATDLTNLAAASRFFAPTCWSRDGAWLSGVLLTAAGLFRGQAVLDLATRHVRAQRMQANIWLAKRAGAGSGDR